MLTMSASPHQHPPIRPFLLPLLDARLPTASSSESALSHQPFRSRSHRPPNEETPVSSEGMGLSSHCRHVEGDLLSCCAADEQQKLQLSRAGPRSKLAWTSLQRTSFTVSILRKCMNSARFMLELAIAVVPVKQQLLAIGVEFCRTQAAHAHMQTN